MKHLEKILSKETKIYEQYLDLAKEKKSALMANQVEILDSITKKEKSLSDKILALEAARQEHIRELGYKPDISIDELLEKTKGPQSLRDTADRLKDLLIECKKFNETNLSMLRQSSNYINHMIKIFTKNTNKSNATYSKGLPKLETGTIADIQG